MKQQIMSYFPGIILATVIAIISKQLVHFMPLLGAATIAILIGVILGNTLFRSTFFAKGTKFSESRLLEYSIVLLGMTITFDTIKTLGIQGLIYIVLQITITLISAIIIGRLLKFDKPFTLLMASGNAICGSSAIASTAPVVNANDDVKGVAIIIVNLMGTIMMLLLPIISFFLYQHSPNETSALIGGTLQSVGQVVASGNLVSDIVAQKAIIFKIVRIIFLVVVVLVLSKYANSEETKTTKKVTPVPWYVIGFFVMCTVSSIGLINGMLNTLAHTVSGWFEIIALAAIGLRLDIRLLLAQGIRYVIYALVLGAVQITAAITLISLLIK